MVKTSVPQCPCGNVPIGRHRTNLQAVGFCEQTSDCIRMRRHVRKAEVKGLLDAFEERQSKPAETQRRDYTPAQKSRKQAKNQRRLANRAARNR
jgi:hypothetical protein